MKMTLPVRWPDALRGAVYGVLDLFVSFSIMRKRKEHFS
jgi:hypothetical protein